MQSCARSHSDYILIWNATSRITSFPDITEAKPLATATHLEDFVRNIPLLLTWLTACACFGFWRKLIVSYSRSRLRIKVRFLAQSMKHVIFLCPLCNWPKAVCCFVLSLFHRKGIKTSKKVQKSLKALAWKQHSELQ